MHDERDVFLVTRHWSL